jgi:H+/Cl- antiporter ClcA/CBS domain-containing protein
VIGGLIVGLMAKFGSEKIRGHGIPEAMEQVLFNKSRIPVRMTFLKPLSAAICIGTGGPFGAEGPIIATGGALGSLVGQLLKTTAHERKTLLAAGAAAGLAGTFGNPISSVLLAIELLLFEFSPRSIIPVAMACSVATAVRMFFEGPGPAFHIPSYSAAGGEALAVYIVIGTLVGVCSVWVTRLVSWLEHQFEHLPIPWIFHPALGGLVVGVIGWKLPQVMGPGYDVIESILSGRMMGWTLVFFFAFKLIAWASSVGSGTSGGTLAPMFAMGGCLAGAMATAVAFFFPEWGVSPLMAALVGMAAIFCGASRAFFASVILAFETTHNIQGILPILAGCTGAYLVSGLLMKHTIMTEKFIQSGARVPEEFKPDLLAHVLVAKAAVRDVITLPAQEKVEKIRESILSDETRGKFQAYPVLDEAGGLRGIAMGRDLLNPKYSGELKVEELPLRKPVYIPKDATLREALRAMQSEKVGRLIVGKGASEKMFGILTRSDIHRMYNDEVMETEREEQVIQISKVIKKKFSLI